MTSNVVDLNLKRMLRAGIIDNHGRTWIPVREGDNCRTTWWTIGGQRILCRLKYPEGKDPGEFDADYAYWDDEARETTPRKGSNGKSLETLPSAKEGLIGAFHRAFTAEDVLLNFLEDFEQVTERRYTWHDGGGTPEGVWVSDDGQHIGSLHNTWPIDGIANLWDVVRVFKFGDLDPSEDDFETQSEIQVGSRPSDFAMKAWAASLPELQ